VVFVFGSFVEFVFAPEYVVDFSFYFFLDLACSVAVGSVGVPMAAESTEILLVNPLELRICSKMALAMGLRYVFPSQTSRILFTTFLLLDFNSIQMNSKNVKPTK